MCLVQVERAPKPLPACATPVMDGMKISTASDYARQAQRSVMEFLLINHPLDCPICDQGGECELQDLAVGYGEGISRFSERKRAVKDKNVGPLIATDMTRCIHCTRCVRFGDEIGGMPELGSTGRGERLEIGTYIEKSIASELSGNVIDVCPVGALTSKPFRFRARAWEMQSREAIAPHDAIGSNVFVHIAQRKVMRVVPRRNDDINEAWISDRDRFSYEGLYAADRLKQPAIKVDGEWRDVDWEDALAFVTARLRAAIDNHGAQQLGVLASPSATAEEHYLLQKLARGLGSSNVDHRLRDGDLSDQDTRLTIGLGMPLAEIEGVNAVLLVGCNSRLEAPLLNHRLRKASLAGSQTFYVNAEAYAQNFDVTAEAIVSPAEWLATLRAIAKAAGDTSVEAEVGEVHQAIASALRDADKGLVTLGGQALAHPQAAALRYWVARIAELTNVHAGALPLGANSTGAALAGMVPHMGPGGSNCVVGLSAAQMFDTPLKTYILHGIEPELDCAHPGALAAVNAAETVISLCAFDSQNMRDNADALLPIGLFAETDGTFINAEGRWQSSGAALAAPEQARPAWKILRVLANSLDISGFDYMRIDSVTQELRAAVADASVSGLKASSAEPSADVDASASLWRCAETPVYSTDALVRRAMSLQQTPLAAVAKARMNTAEARRAGVHQSALVRVLQGNGSVELELELDDSVADGCVCVPTALPGTAALGGAMGPISIEAVAAAMEA